jgi:hypothetical protein
MTTTIYQALCACFGLSPSSVDASLLIREAYQEPENAPRPPRNADVIYFSIEPDSVSTEAPAAYSAENAAEASFSMAVSFFAAWKFQVICYGPHALTNARQIRAFLYVDGTNMPRYILRKVGIRPIPDPPEPLLLHEPEGSLWRLRCDLSIQLRSEEKQTHPVRQGAVSIAPAVVVRTG